MSLHHSLYTQWYNQLKQHIFRHTTTLTIKTNKSTLIYDKYKGMNDILYFFSNSADKKPGMGVNERVKDATLYSELSKIKDWRKILSNFYVCDIKYKGKTYRTVEHIFQSEKLKLKNADVAHTFTVESGTVLGMGDGNAARASRKILILTPDELRLWDKIKSDIMREALHCKFNQSELSNKVLLLTMNAELWHGARGVPMSRQYELESVREALRR